MQLKKRLLEGRADVDVHGGLLEVELTRTGFAAQLLYNYNLESNSEHLEYE